MNEETQDSLCCRESIEPQASGILFLCQKNFGNQRKDKRDEQQHKVPKKLNVDSCDKKTNDDTDSKNPDPRDNQMFTLHTPTIIPERLSGL